MATTAEYDTTLKIDNLRDVRAPLYYRYPRECNPQPAYVEMDEDGVITADSDGEICGAVTFDVWHGRTLRWPVSCYVSGRALVDYLEDPETRTLFDRVYSGHSQKWDGSNYVGRLDDDAQDASDKIREELEALGEREENLAQVWDLDHWIGNCGDPLGQWPDGMSLKDAVADIEKNADLDNVELDGDVRDWLLDYAQRENERGNCYRPEILAALYADGRHPVGEDDEPWTPAPTTEKAEKGASL